MRTAPTRARFSVLLRILYTCIVSFTLGRDAHSLDPQKSVAQYAHDIWNTRNGLPEADVMAILQTHDGYLWVGTEEGLARFDGTHFVVFDRKTASLPNNRIQALAETSDGSLWVGTENGLSRFKDRRFTNYSTKDGLPGNNIRALWAESNGTLWITTAAGVRFWDGGGFEHAPSLEPIAQNSPRQVLRTQKGDLWVANDTGLGFLGAGSTKISSGPATLEGRLIRTIMMEYPTGVLWIGTNLGLYRLSQGRVLPYPLGSHTHAEVTALLQDRHHNLWVGTLGDGLIRVNQRGISHYSVSDGLSSVEVKSLHEDRSGNLWVGTFGGGLEVFRDTMFTPYGKPEGVSQDVVWTVMEARDSSIWMGTQAGGLSRLKNSRVTSYRTSTGFSDNTVGSLLEGQDGTLWLGKDSGLGRFKDGNVLPVPVKRRAFHEQVHAIYQDRSGTIWAGTRTSGLMLLRGAGYRRITTEDGLAGNNVQTIIPSKQGGVWIGTLGGLSYLSNDHFTNYTTKNGLSADPVVSLYEDPEGTLWIGTDGLARLRDGKITTYSDRQGLFDQNVLSILEDDSGYLWLSTNKGIFRVSKQQLNDLAEAKTKQLTLLLFGSADGMRSSECNGGSSPSAWKDRKGNLWFATVAGALKLDPRWVAANPQPLQVHVEDIWADRKYVAPSEGLRLPPGGHELELHYSAPYFAGANRVRYKYRLEGFVKDWEDAGSRTGAYYTNLPPGEYRFRVAASAFNAQPGEAEAELSFSLTPYFYQTPVFYTLAALVISGLIFLVWLWTNRVMIARQNELKHLVKARTLELEAEKTELLEAKAALALQVSHDPLTGLLNRRAIFHVLEQDMDRAQRENTSLAVLLLDLDHFKHVNDTYGHLVGDEVLRAFARNLERKLRPYDHAGRFGGEEFLIVLPGLDERREDRIHELHQQLCQKHLVSSGVELCVNCSVGVAWFDPGIRNIESLLQLADQALYRAKANGRNCVETAEGLPAT